ncbi:MAG: hypothetical protein C9356_12125 [Oleiphilus sp.]|nr:MAG: hypothetical protein C9356_12125 [Oleiphilus sp.]
MAAVNYASVSLVQTIGEANMKHPLAVIILALLITPVHALSQSSEQAVLQNINAWVPGALGPVEGPLTPLPFPHHASQDPSFQSDWEELHRMLRNTTTCPQTVKRARERLRSEIGDPVPVLDDSTIGLIYDGDMQRALNPSEQEGCRKEYQAVLISQLESFPERFYQAYIKLHQQHNAAKQVISKYERQECTTREEAQEARTVYERYIHSRTNLWELTNSFSLAYLALIKSDIDYSEVDTNTSNYVHRGEITLPRLSYQGDKGEVSVRIEPGGQVTAGALGNKVLVMVEPQIQIDEKAVISTESLKQELPAPFGTSPEQLIVAFPSYKVLDKPDLNGPVDMEYLQISETIPYAKDHVRRSITIPAGYRYCRNSLGGTRMGGPASVYTSLKSNLFDYLIDHGGLHTFSSSFDGRIELIHQQATECEMVFNQCAESDYDEISPHLATIAARPERTPLLSTTVYRYGGPEIASDGKRVKFKQHALYLDLYGPEEMRQQYARELTTIKDACLTAGLVLQGTVTFLTAGLDHVVALITNRLDVLEETVRTCIFAQNFGNAFVDFISDGAVETFELDVRSRHWWD